MTKLSRQNVGGVDYAMVGCTLTGVCASAASDYIKAVTLSDGDILSDGMSVVVTFANGNTAGTAPASLTIYSSDQVNYFSDSDLTQPFTLAPAGCYDIEYTGTGNAYTYISYPVIQMGGVSAPVCNSCGKKTSGAVWDAGDAVLLLYSGSKFMTVSGLTEVVATGNNQPVTSGGVANAKYTKLFDTKSLSESGWYKIASFSRRSRGSFISIELDTGYYYQFSSSHKIQINYGWLKADVFDFAQDEQTVFDKIKICWNSNNTDYMGIYVHYTPNAQNPVYLNINACTERFIPVDFETDSLTWENTIEYNLGASGVYINGQNYNTVDSVTSGNLQPVTSNAVYNKFNALTADSNITSFVKSTPDFNSYILIADVTTWYNSTSSSQQQAYHLAGMLINARNDGLDRTGCGNIVLSVSYFRNEQTLPNNNLAHIEYSGNTSLTRACLIQYNNKIYLAIKTVQDQARRYMFFGYYTSTPLLTLVPNSETVTELYVN